MISRSFSRNEAFFSTFSWKVDRNAKTWLFVRKVGRFCPDRWFLVLFYEMRHFLHFFPEKLIEMQRHGSLFDKLQSFGQIDDFWFFFTKSSTFCNFFLKSSSKCKDMVVCSKSCKVFAKSMMFRAFSRIEPLFANFCWKVHRNTKHGSSSTKLHSFGQIDEFSWFFTKSGRFRKCLTKSSSKRKNMVVCSKSCKFWPNPSFFVFFHEMNHVLQPFP